MKTVPWHIWSLAVERWNQLSPSQRAQRAAECRRDGHRWAVCASCVFCLGCLKQDLGRAA